MKLDTALFNLRQGETLRLMDGIYALSDLSTTFGVTSAADSRTTIEAVDGSRPIITHADGFPPGIAIPTNMNIYGIWFGGERPVAMSGSRTIVMQKTALLEDCTIFGYINGIQNGGDAHGNTYRRNRFARCGYQLYWHPIYVANGNASSESDGVLTEDCIFIGCEGYSVHYYHEPSWGVAQYNFIGNALYGLAVQGDMSGPVSGNRNIIWNVTGNALYNATPLGACDHNVWKGVANANQAEDSNYFVSPVPIAGTNPVVWQESDVAVNLGNSSANIDAACDALEVAFEQSVEAIHADPTIEGNFTILAAVVTAWKSAAAGD